MERQHDRVSLCCARAGERNDAAHLHQFTDKLKVAPRLACHDTAKDLAIPTPNLHYPRLPTAPPLRPNATARADGAALPVGASSGVGAAGVASTAINRSLLIFFAGDHPTAECRHVRARTTTAPAVLACRRCDRISSIHPRGRRSSEPSARAPIQRS